MDYFSVNHSEYLVYIGVATIEALEVDFSCLTVKDNPKITLGSVACRKLLWELQTHLNLLNSYQSVVLNESQFPYYFLVNDKTYWVSFSHSQSHVAVMVVVDNESKNVSPKFGIDIEDKRISDAVARRFFCDAEWAWLECLTDTQKSQAKTLLWTLKESLIKAQVNEKLVIGLKQNLLKVLDKTALAELLQENEQGFNQVILENNLFGFSPKSKCGFVLLG